MVFDIVEIHIVEQVAIGIIDLLEGIATGRIFVINTGMSFMIGIIDLLEGIATQPKRRFVAGNFHIGIIDLLEGIATAL